MNKENRRGFIKKSSIMVGGGLMMSSLPWDLQPKPIAKENVKLGLIGVGLRGTEHLKLLLNRDDCKVTAICDIDKKAANNAQMMIEKTGSKIPHLYTADEMDYLNLVARDDLDGVIIATPWEWHTPMAVAAMKQGKYAGVEVSAANTLEECWDLVNTHETTGTPCMILENVCYRRDVLAVLNMVRQNLFGELIHMECGYQHDLREVKFNNGQQPYGGGVEFGEKGYSEARWRTWHSVHRNGDLYPTHGIGPIATMLNIERGNRFVYLTSTATKSRGLHNHIIKHGGDDHPNASVKFKLGDIITTVIKTARDETIIISHDTNLPRPYSLGFRVQGENGIWMDINQSIYFEGKSREPHRWESADPWLEKYDHPLWKQMANKAIGAGHGGMDFFVIHAFIESIKRQINTPLDVYDAAAWSAISPLSELSISQGSAPVEFPDFSRGKWQDKTLQFALKGDF